MKTSPCPPLNILMDPICRISIEDHVSGCEECRRLLELTPSEPDLSPEEIALMKMIFGVAAMALALGWQRSVFSKCWLVSNDESASQLIAARIKHDNGLAELHDELQKLPPERRNYMIRAMTRGVIALMVKGHDETAGIPMDRLVRHAIMMVQEGPCYVQEFRNGRARGSVEGPETSAHGPTRCDPGQNQAGGGPTD